MRNHYFAILLISTVALQCQKSNEPTNTNVDMPVINQITVIYYPSAQGLIFRGDKDVIFECDADDSNGLIIDYIWEATAGTIQSAEDYIWETPYGNFQGAPHQARWEAPIDQPGTYNIICTVKDNDENTAMKNISVDVLNRKPIISKIEIYPETFGEHNPNINVGNRAQFITFVDNPENDDLEYKYTLPDTTTDWMWQSIFWTAPANLPTVKNIVKVLVKDEFGAVANDSLYFYVW